MIGAMTADVLATSTGLTARRLRVPLRGPSGPLALRHVRRGTAEILRGWLLEELVDVGCLVVDELLANVVRHCPTTDTATVALVLEDGGLRIEVADTTRDMPIVRCTREWDEDGRGLHLVATVADWWAAWPTPAGKVVCAVLRAPGPPIFEQVRRQLNGRHRNHPADRGM